MAHSLTAANNSFYFGLTFNRYTLLASHQHLVWLNAYAYAMLLRFVTVILRNFCFCYLQRKRKSLLNIVVVSIYFCISFSAKSASFKASPTFWRLCVELSIKISNWRLCTYYKPHSQPSSLL